ncbi:MAG: response regulator [Pyrinomonadaceae bacterium]
MATILIVDDDNRIRETLNELLAETHECHTADRAEQALAYLELQNYDAVLTDIAMPGLSGREILKCTQEHHPATPVIVISGDANEYAAKELIAMGAFAYLTKPFHLDEVEDTVNRAIMHHHELVKTLPVQTSNEPAAEDAAAEPNEPS